MTRLRIELAKVSEHQPIGNEAEFWNAGTHSAGNF